MMRSDFAVVRRVDTRVTVETPEGVDFEFRLAGPGRRVGAWLLDLCIKAGVVAIVLVVSALTGAAAFFPGFATMLIFASLFLLNWLYNALFEGYWDGQTPGKRIMRLRVVRTNGTPVGPWEAYGRGLVLMADMLPALLLLFPLGTIGVVSMLATRRLQRLGDLIFDTMVIDESREHITRPPGLADGIDRLTRAECSGRFHVPERTIAVIERLFEPNRRVSDARREELAAILANALRKRLGFEEPPVGYGVSPGSRVYRHGLFLRRVLATFRDDPNGIAGEPPDLRTSPPTVSREPVTTVAAGEKEGQPVVPSGDSL